MCIHICSEWTRNVSLDLAILGFLSSHPKTGYELKTRCFSGPAGALWAADQAQIYRTLDRLAKDGQVSVTRRRQAGKPDRKVYELTRAGTEALDEMLAAVAAPPPLRDPFLLQLYFGHTLDDDALVEILTARREAHQQRLDELRELSDELSKDHSLAPRDAVLRHTAFDGAIAQQRALIDWLDDCVEAASDGALPGSNRGIGQRHLFGS
jgi:PadR family transcriptional regulator, regulatory protein AphA